MAKLKLSDTWKPFRGPNQMYSITSCRFGVKLVEMGRKPHRSRRVWKRACKSPSNAPRILVDRGIFKKLTVNWKTGQGYRLQEDYTIVPVTIDKDAWISFATGLDYYITPTETTSITGFKAFIAWNQAALSCIGYRWTLGLNFPYDYPTVQWPDPPATYDPFIITDVDAYQASPHGAIMIKPTPDPYLTEHAYIVYTTGPAYEGQLETERALLYAHGDKMYFPGEPDLWYWDNGNGHGEWGCYWPGWITAAMQIVDWTTGSPSPIVGKRIHVV